MIGFSEAIGLIETGVSALETEVIAIDQAYGRVLREDLLARSDAPVAPVAAMDGYAVNSAALAEDMGFPVVAEARAGGARRLHIGKGEAARIFTGAMLPEGADLVIMQEYARLEQGRVWFASGHGPARHIREAGSDFTRGTVLVPAGTCIDARQLVLCAAADRADVTASRRARVAILATGDELAAPGFAHGRPGAIPESISLPIAGMGGSHGASLVGRRIVPDDPVRLAEAADALLQESDLLIVLGGASVGDRDYSKEVLQELGLELIFSKVAIKPGKPVWFGRVGPKAVLGLPGNPTSAMVTATLFLPCLLARLHGADRVEPWQTLRLAEALPRTGARETFVRAIRQGDEVAPLDNQSSAAQLAMARADRLIRCPAGQQALPPGTPVQTIPF